MTFLRQDGDLISAPFGSNTINRGQLVTVDAAGKARAAEAGAKPFLGVAMESTNGLVQGEVRIYRTGVFQLAIDSVAAADLGKAVAVAASDKVTTTVSATAPAIGQIVEVIDNKTVGVRLD
nr:MAG TPA: capsid fiber protein [Caudoviricetes sp.]